MSRKSQQRISSFCRHCMSSCDFCNKFVDGAPETACTICEQVLYVCNNCVPSDGRGLWGSPIYFRLIREKHSISQHGSVDLI